MDEPHFNDSATYWLGKMVAIVEMESAGGLTKHQAVGEMQRVVRSMKVSADLFRSHRRQAAPAARKEAVNDQG